jgi:hypothetical protein
MLRLFPFGQKYIHTYRELCCDGITSPADARFGLKIIIMLKCFYGLPVCDPRCHHRWESADVEDFIIIIVTLSRILPDSFTRDSSILACAVRRSPLFSKKNGALHVHARGLLLWRAVTRVLRRKHLTRTGRGLLGRRVSSQPPSQASGSRPIFRDAPKTENKPRSFPPRERSQTRRAGVTQRGVRIRGP